MTTTSWDAENWRPGVYFFFAITVGPLRAVTVLEGSGVQISMEAGTRSLPAAKSANSVRLQRQNLVEDHPVTRAEVAAQVCALPGDGIGQIGYEPVMFVWPARRSGAGNSR